MRILQPGRAVSVGSPRGHATTGRIRFCALLSVATKAGTDAGLGVRALEGKRAMEPTKDSANDNARRAHLVLTHCLKPDKGPIAMFGAPVTLPDRRHLLSACGCESRPRQPYCRVCEHLRAQAWTISGNAEVFAGLRSRSGIAATGETLRVLAALHLAAALMDALDFPAAAV